MNKRFGWFGLCFVAVLLLNSSAMGAAFIKFDGVDGESNDANHPKWSNVLEVSQGYLIQGINDLNSRSRQREVVQVEDIAIAMELDKAGVKIADALLKGKVFPTVDIEFTFNLDGSSVTYYRYEISNVTVTSYHLTARGNDESGPGTQEIGLEFTKIKATYSEYDSEGKFLGHVEYSWEVGL